MTRSLPVLLGLVLLAGGLAGCIGSEEGASPGAETEQASLSADDPDASPAAGDAADQQADVETLAFPETMPAQVTEWANGTFTAHEACRLTGCATGQAVRLVELDGQLADHAPTRISAELTYDTGPRLFVDTIDLYVWSQDGTFYTFDRTEEEGREAVETTVLKGSEPLVVQVFYEWPTGAEPEVDYQLRVDAETSPTHVPAGVPVAVDAEPGQRILAETSVDERASGSDAAPSLLTYGPDDALLDRYEASGESLELRLPADTDAGEHVLVPPEEGPAVELSTNGTTAAMRALPLDYQPGDAHPVDGAEPVEWSFEAAEHPLGVGLVYEPHRAMAVTAERGQATVTGPQGTVLEGHLGCGTCIGNGFYWAMQTPIGAEGLAAGGYDAVYEPTAEAGAQVAHVLVTYER